MDCVPDMCDIVTDNGDVGDGLSSDEVKSKRKHISCQISDVCCSIACPVSGDLKGRENE